MKARDPIRLPVRVLFHLNEGYTRVLVEPFVGIGLATRDDLDIPTEVIPLHLRPLGSRYMLVWPPYRLEAGDSVDEIRAAMRCRVEEMPLAP